MTTWYWIGASYCVAVWLLAPVIIMKGVKDLDKETDN
jgi:hypothetical protein